ncbi:MAG: MBL fold metallo-hydrolase, partial [Candidatus Bilamarchaeaceae archaeon]
MASITLFGGAGEIGGNKVLIEDRKTKIFLDFGQAFGLLDDYFVDWLKPRGRFGLRDYFALGLMPKMPGLYNKEALKHTELRHSEPEYDAVFISHAHQDHIAHLPFLEQEIPVYMGETCKKILDSTQETTGACFYSEHSWKKKDGTEVAPNKIRTFRSGERITVGDLEVTPIHVDHSVPGAYGFLVETSGGAIAYTGDLRKHGSKPEMTMDFINSAGEAEPAALIIEGTRVAEQESRKSHTEQFVFSESRKVVEKAKGLVLAMRYPKDLDRFRTFYTIAKECGKELVISLKTAHLLLSLKGDRIGLPDPLSDEHIRIYGRKMLVYRQWETPLLERCVDSAWVKKNQKELIWELDFPQMQELIDVEPTAGSACIHSISEPFEEDPSSQLQDEVLQNWLDRFGMERHQLHASGHASMDEIFGFIEEVGAKLIPLESTTTTLYNVT